MGRTNAASPSPGTPGEGGGEGLLLSPLKDPHPSPLPAYRERGQEVSDTVSSGALVVDDYGHHPTEIAATLEAARQAWPGRRLVLAFQPHRYTRTRDLIDDFGRVLSEADALFVTEVYAAGEEPIANADGRAICRAVRGRGVLEPVFVEDVHELPGAHGSVLADGDVVLTMGAGSIGAVAHGLPAALGRGAAP